MRGVVKNAAVKKAADLVGSEQALAIAIGYTKAAVNQWKTGVRQIPAEACVKIERATAGKVKRAQLRPEVFGKIT